MIDGSVPRYNAPQPLHRPSQEVLPKENHTAQAFLPDGAYKPFCEGIQIRGARRKPQCFYAGATQHLPELPTEQGGPVVNQ
jgi:hypothetical protein